MRGRACSLSTALTSIPTGSCRRSYDRFSLTSRPDARTGTRFVIICSSRMSPTHSSSCSTSDVTGPLNLASGRPITLREIVERVADLLGRRSLLQLGAIPAAPTDAPLVVADISRAARELPQWQPRVGLDEGLLASIRWWRERASAEAAATAR